MSGRHQTARSSHVFGPQTHPSQNNEHTLWVLRCCGVTHAVCGQSVHQQALVSRIISKQSPQLAQCAASRDRNALRKPRPPMLSGRLAVSFADVVTMSPFTCNMAHRHCHNPTSWAVAKTSTNSGGTVRSQKLDLGAAQNNNSNHADCKSGTGGLRSKRTECSRVFFPKKDLTKSGCPMTPTLAYPALPKEDFGPQPTLWHSP